MLISKKISAKFRPNFAKFGNFGGGRNFGDTEIKILADDFAGCHNATCGEEEGIYTAGDTTHMRARA